jgi:hypothetical protein
VQTRPTDAQPASQLWSSPPSYQPSPAVVVVPVNALELEAVMIVLMAVVLVTEVI